MSYAKFIRANLLRNKTRTGLTLFSLVVAFLLFGLLQPVQRIFTEGPDLGNSGRLVVTPKHSIADMLPVRLHQEITDLAGAAVAAHMTWFGGTYLDPANFFPKYAVPPDEFLAAMPEIQLAPEERAAFINNRQGAILGQATASKYGLKVGDRLPLLPNIWHNRDGTAWQFDIVGIFTTDQKGLVGDDAMYMQWAYFDEYRAFGNGTVSTLLVKTREGFGEDKLALQVDNLTANSSNETRTMTEQQYALTFAQQMGDVGLIVNTILGAVFFTILLVTGNTVAQSTRERIPELAVMKVLGFHTRTVVSVVATEILLLMLLSAAMGLCSAAMILSGIDTWLPELSQLGSLAIGRQVILAGMGLALALALVVGTPAVLKLLRLRLIDALRA